MDKKLTTPEDLLPIIIRNTIVLSLRNDGISVDKLFQRLEELAGTDPRVEQIPVSGVMDVINHPDHDKLETMKRLADVMEIDLSDILKPFEGKE